MGMYKFGGYRGENVLLCSSVVEVKEKLFRLLFGKAPVVVSTILKSLLKLPLVEPRWVDDEKLEVFKKGFKLIPVQKQWWSLKFQRGSIGTQSPERDVDGVLDALAGTVPLPSFDLKRLHDGTLEGIKQMTEPDFGGEDFLARFASHTEKLMGLRESAAMAPLVPPKGKEKVKPQVTNNIMNAAGYILFNGVVTPSPDFLRKFKEMSHVASPIFNSSKGNKDNDMLRLQMPVPADWFTGLNKFLFFFLKDRVPSGWVGLISKPGCREQEAHVDWDPSALPKEMTRVVRIGVLVALQNDAD